MIVRRIRWQEVQLDLKDFASENTEHVRVDVSVVRRRIELVVRESRKRDVRDFRDFCERAWRCDWSTVNVSAVSTEGCRHVLLLLYKRGGIEKRKCFRTVSYTHLTLP